jgi:hypothetical protein
MSTPDETAAVPSPAEQLAALKPNELNALRQKMIEDDGSTPPPSRFGLDQQQSTSVGTLMGSFMKVAFGATISKAGVGILTGRTHSMGDFILGAFGAGIAGAGKNLMTGEEATTKDGVMTGLGLEMLGGHQGILGALLQGPIMMKIVPMLGKGLALVLGNLFGDKKDNSPGFSFSSLLGVQPSTPAQ